jgi:hypothetical protein
MPEIVRSLSQIVRNAKWPPIAGGHFYLESLVERAVQCTSRIAD